MTALAVRRNRNRSIPPEAFAMSPDEILRAYKFVVVSRPRLVAPTWKRREKQRDGSWLWVTYSESAAHGVVRADAIERDQKGRKK